MKEFSGVIEMGESAEEELTFYFEDVIRLDFQSHCISLRSIIAFRVSWFNLVGMRGEDIREGLVLSEFKRELRLHEEQSKAGKKSTKYKVAASIWTGSLDKSNKRNSVAPRFCP